MTRPLLLREPRLWLSSFGIATILGFATAIQVWLSVEVTRRPASFWEPRFLQPQLIPWYVWALLTPPLVVLVQRLRRVRQPAWRSAALYVGLGAASIVVHSIASGFALGWWWSFPSLIPMSPEWHIAHQLRSRTVFGVLIFALIAVGFRRRDGATASRAAPERSIPLDGLSRPPATVALRTSERVVFVTPDQIDWIEADRDHVIVHARGAAYRVRSGLAAFESRLPPSRLVRVSRSAIVNLGAVAELQRWFRGDYVIILRDGTKIVTGKKYRDRITRLF
jgi:hypothetical protein